MAGGQDRRVVVPTSRAAFDRNTGAASVIDYPHYEHHDGCAFHVDAISGVLGAGGTLVVAFRTGATYAHLFIDWSVKVDGSIDLIEAPSWNNASGVKITPTNKNRNSSVVSAFEEDTTGPWVANGTIQDPAGLVGGTAFRVGSAFSARNSTGGRGRNEEEWILAPSTKYAVRATAISAANAAELILDWYELGTN